MSVAAIFVHYHAAGWLTAAVTSLRADLDRDGLEAQVVVVDNGSRPSSATSCIRSAFPTSTLAALVATRAR